MDGLKDLGIAFSNNGGANAEAVAEHTLMLMLMVCKVENPQQALAPPGAFHRPHRLTRSPRCCGQDATQYWLNAKEGNWAEGIERRSGTRELAGQTVGIIGFGNIGRLVVRNTCRP